MKLYIALAILFMPLFVMLYAVITAPPEEGGGEEDLHGLVGVGRALRARV